MSAFDEGRAPEAAVDLAGGRPERLDGADRMAHKDLRFVEVGSDDCRQRKQFIEERANSRGLEQAGS